MQSRDGWVPVCVTGKTGTVIKKKNLCSFRFKSIYGELLSHFSRPFCCFKSLPATNLQSGCVKVRMAVTFDEKEGTQYPNRGVWGTSHVVFLDLGGCYTNMFTSQEFIKLFTCDLCSLPDVYFLSFLKIIKLNLLPS